MQTLEFNTTTKKVKVTEGKLIGSEILYEFNNVPTVRVDPIGFYEVVQGIGIDGARLPVARFPISNTNMLIEK
jgi:hypothetical protein